MLNNKLSLAKTLFFSIAILLAAAQASARTWPQKTYDRDPARNYDHVFGVYRPLTNYNDADFAEGAAMASPLYNPIYASYDVIVVVNRTNISAAGKIVERAQRARVYVRAEALARLNQANMQNLTYDEASGLLLYLKTTTGSPGHGTPPGHYRVLGFSSDHKSAKYGNAPMPNAVWFNEVGIYTHGVDPKLFGILGTSPASHGCVRLETQRAGDLFHLVGHIGQGSVDALDRSGNPITDAKGNVRKIEAYKTLYIIR
ncbi:MAG: L,D-transpeptidase [Bdellovibrionota bacterium]